ncbi:MAG: M1 family metallopeptidase, partial [Gemmatimonadales bacterium]
MLALLLISSLTQAQLPLQGSPTPYWQQTVHYDIRARLDEPTGVLGGTEQVEYINHSPDTLRTFALHLYLNAFRPGSRWAAADSVEQRRRFNDLPDPEFGFNHVRNVRIQGQSVAPIYPFAPDSTIVRFVLPAPLAPGDSITVNMDWDARPSTLPRRQGRKGRRFDFAQWYPRVVVYDRFGWEEHPLYPAGEFYGEFGTFLVDLDLPADQVMGATGVPVCGDPGWERANAVPGRPIDYQRDWYGNAATPAMQARCAAAVAAGRKRVIWYAGDVHHFAMSLNPDYRYEEGRQGTAVVRVLYQPGDEKSWGGGLAVQRTETALAWLGQLFAPFPWPQITNVHRIEGGGTEFPMMVHDGSASQGLIVHEGGHNYLMGILANNEWKEGWLDEGFTSFQTAWFQEAGGHDPGWLDDEQYILGLDLDGWSEPTSLVSEDYRDFFTYNTMIYTRGQLFLWELRSIVGDEVMRQILQTYYQRWKFKHVDEQKFMAVAEEVSHQDLSVFFAQFLHTTELYDYAVGRVKSERTETSEKSEGAEGWTTRIEVIRKSPGMIPVDVMVVS